MREERPLGRILNSETGQPFTFSDPCITRGATVGYDRVAHADALSAVKNFLTAVFKLSP
jgi:hypothetical protein